MTTVTVRNNTKVQVNFALRLACGQIIDYKNCVQPGTAIEFAIPTYLTSLKYVIIGRRSKANNRFVVRSQVLPAVQFLLGFIGLTFLHSELVKEQKATSKKEPLSEEFSVCNNVYVDFSGGPVLKRVQTRDNQEIDLVDNSKPLEPTIYSFTIHEKENN